MADPLISLDTDRAFAQPGGQARVTVTVANPGTVVEGYWLQVLGPAAAYAEVVPPEVSVYPQQEVTAAVVFSPPTGTSAPGGLQPFGVMARSTLDAQISAVAEGDIEIGEVYGLQAKVIPVTSSGRWRGRHVIQLSNWGNAPAQLRMSASDPDDALGFHLSPEYVDLLPGGRASVRVSAVTKHAFLRGAPVRLPFQVVGERLDADAGGAPPAGSGYGDPSRPVVDAALSQKPILSKSLMTVLVLLLAGIIALFAYLQLKETTPDEPLAPRGGPAKPQLRVTSAGPDSVGLSWTPIDQAEHYTLQYVDPKTDNVTNANSIDGAVNSSTVAGLPAQTEVCFRLSATRGGLTGPLSDKVCSTTTVPVPTPTPTPTSVSSSPPASSAPPSASASPSATLSSPTATFTPGDPNTDPVMKQTWISVASVLPKTAHIEAEARTEVQTLTEAGLSAKYLDSGFYQRLLITGPTPPPTGPVEPSFLVFLGPFPTEVEAQNQCADVNAKTGEDLCVVAQADPP